MRRTCDNYEYGDVTDGGSLFLHWGVHGAMLLAGKPWAVESPGAAEEGQCHGLRSTAMSTKTKSGAAEPCAVRICWRVSQTHSPPHQLPTVPTHPECGCNLAIPRRFIVFFRIIKYGAFSFALHGVSVNRLHVIGCGSDADGGRKNRLRSNCNVKRPTRAGGTFAGTRQTLTIRRTSAAQQSHFYRAQTPDVCHDPLKELILRLASE